MKKISLSIAALALVFAVTFTSCKKDDIEDTNAPIISITGGTSINHTLNEAFANPVATATDETDGDLTASISVSGSVNKDLAGTYTLTYTVADKAGNKSTKDVTVVVANTLANLAGTYSVSETRSGTALNPYTQTITVSNTTNYKITFQRFGNYENGIVYATFYDGHLSIPSQNVTCGNPPTLRTFMGGGSISGINVNYGYNFNENGTGGNGSATLTKQ